MEPHSLGIRIHDVGKRRGPRGRGVDSSDRKSAILRAQITPSPTAPPPYTSSSIILFKPQSRSFKRLALDGNRIFPLQVTSRPVSLSRSLNQQKKIIRFVQIKSVMSRNRAPVGGRGRRGARRAGGGRRSSNPAAPLH
ncbi:hypothetical protein EVAR_51328_1 [Eumeta japonica]|uniref:Uncharacterized protein n=1 Tax=Eumeta variegata TaxID=151549 RepID=A0A4C1Y117_EUMVA|nr:hypothetical protein EVAR_51328_1 [Eumeta japonica]